MNGEIIAVGSELLLGQIANTNAQYLGKKLAEIGMNVYYHTVVGDNGGRLKQALKIAESRSDFVIITGGLGPTKDDLTKETISEQLNRPLIFDEGALLQIENYFRKMNRPITENNRKQALVIEGCTVLPNHWGMAPGMVIENRGKVYMLLPGPPSEMKPMYETFGEKILLSFMGTDGKIVSRVLRFFGIGEAQIETELEDFIVNQSNPTIAPLAEDGEVTIRLTAKEKTEDKANELLNELEEKILDRVGKYFYGYDDQSIMKTLFTYLKENDLTIACAESLTGGLFQQQFTSFPGAGDVFKGGVVCYSTNIKHKVLQVKKETIETVGVVSEECALQLAENVRQLMETDIGISFTGVAGPTEQEGKPVGTVFIGISIKGKGTYPLRLQLAGTREMIRLRTVKHGAYHLWKKLKSS